MNRSEFAGGTSPSNPAFSALGYLDGVKTHSYKDSAYAENGCSPFGSFSGEAHLQSMVRDLPCSK